MFGVLFALCFVVFCGLGAKELGCMGVIAVFMGYWEFVFCFFVY